MTEHIFGAPLQWLETTSHGEILQRSDRDTRIIDEDLTYAIGPLFALASQLVTVLWSRSGARAGAAGVALSFAVQLSEIVPGCLQRISSLESGVRTAEKVAEYASIEQEPADGLDVEDSWPAKGELQVSKYVAGYGPGLSDTLRDITFTIKPGERVGVVGRTGAGKSTLALSFARLTEKRDGSIRIDSVDISRVKLEVLRRRILVISQDPYLFGGTIRAIVDPDCVYPDEELVAALEQYGFFLTTQNTGKQGALGASSGLSFIVSDGGANLSQGQRQILYLVKAMLSRKKVVIMDEATSAVDMEADSTIQAMIREGLQNATVMVIAHRLATVAHLDKVLVLQDGKVAEFGSPTELYQQEGKFWALVNHSVDKEDLIKSFKGNEGLH
ncbi:hypothetical protein K4F52_006657 [Lecanicillium sp. MT-2017a]|nr:hypothetical protein K4F52_006657 [Lecanicillium sp. MT-2017a]